MGPFRGLGVPQLARNQGKGHNGVYGSAGLALGPRYGNGGTKGLMQGYGNAAGVSNGYGAKPNGYGGPRGGAMRPQPGYGNGAVPNGHGSKPNGYGAAAGTGVFKGYGAQSNGYGTMQNGKGQTFQGADVSNGKSYKGRVPSPQQQAEAAVENVSSQHVITEGEVPDVPEPTSGLLVMVTQEKYQKLPPYVPQGINYKQTPLIHEATPEPVSVHPEARDSDHAPEPEPAPMGPRDKGQKGATSGPAPVVPQSNPVPEAEAETGYGHGAYPAAGYEIGKSYGGYGQGYGQGYGAGPQPDFASLSQGVPTADGKSGGNQELLFNGAPVVPAGLDGINQFKPQSAGFGKLGGMYGGLGGSPFGGQPSNTKYGIGGLQFGGEPISAGNYDYGVNPYVPAGDGKSPGKYGYGGFPNGGQLLSGNGNMPGKYGYGRIPYEVQQAGLSPEAKSAGQYDKQGPYQSQPLESATEGTTGLTHEALPHEPDSAGKPYVKGEVPTPALAVEENAGYINGQVQPEAPTLSTTLAHQFVPVESFTPDMVPVDVQDLHDPEGTASLLGSAPVTDTQGEAQEQKQPDDLHELPRQIHIQQHLKLHFHPQGAKNGKYDLNGFFGNSGYQG
ncbi:calymmin [Odontesthes bonariensis]|uniref:calymmin n=1 Tax=Odontesthes bonariensis TaxID=219752 RepID=UPI003F58424A